MSTKLLKGIIIAAAAFMSLPTSAQDPEFSQYYAAPLHLNPSLAGISYGPRINLNYRNQWPGIENAYSTYSVSYDQHVNAINGGLGVSVMADRVAGGLLNTYKADVMYAYQVPLTKEYGLRFGAEIGYMHRSINWNDLTFQDQLDPLDQSSTTPTTSEPKPDNLNKSILDFGAGAVFFTPKFFAGVGVQHLTQPNESFYDLENDQVERLPIRTAVHMGGVIELNKIRSKDYYLAPNALYIHQGKFSQINVGTQLNLGYVFGGMWFRHTFENSDAIIANVGVNFDKWSLGYSYDFTISELSIASGGAHEISLTLNLNEDNPLDPEDKASKLNCPVFLQ
jgi:type IX secretion system PorP/SprF family membrane protein